MDFFVEWPIAATAHEILMLFGGQFFCKHSAGRPDAEKV